MHRKITKNQRYEQFITLKSNGRQYLILFKVVELQRFNGLVADIEKQIVILCQSPIILNAEN